MGVLLTTIVVVVSLLVLKGEKFVPNLEIEASNSLEMYIDDTPQKLTYVVECNESYYVEFILNSNVVSVSDDGYATAHSIGTCLVEIKVTSTSLTKSVNVSVTVKERKTTFVPKLELTAQDILSLCNDDTPIKLDYFVSCNEEYNVEFDTSSDILSVDSFGEITPNKVGTCTVTIRVNSASGLQAKKDIFVTISKSQITANMEIKDMEDNTPQKIFMSNQYILEITCSKKLIYTPKLDTSKNISNLTLDKKQEQKLIYTFTITDYGETFFTFSYKDYSQNLTKQAYTYISKIDTCFTRKIENMQILLYLFNKNYEYEANLNNFYQNIQFYIQNQTHVDNIYSVKISSDIISLNYSSEQYTILAQTTGETQLTIYANDGSNYFVTYTIIVQEIHISSINFTQENVLLDINEEYEYQVDYSPIYALTNLIYFLNDEPYSNTKLQFSSTGTNILKVEDSLSCIKATLTINVTQKENPFTIFFNEILTQYMATFENDILTLTTTEETIDIPFSYHIHGVTKTECDISYTSNGITLENLIVNINNIILILQGKGSLNITLTSKENPSLSYTFTVLIL